MNKINDNKNKEDLLNKKIKKYLSIIKKESENAVAYSNLGTALRESEDYERAEQCYKKAISINPEMAITNYNYAILLMKYHKYTEAAYFFRKAIELKPDFAEAYCDFATVLENLGMPGKAEKFYKQAVAIKPDFIEPLWNLSLLQLSVGNFEEGWKNYRYRLHDNKIDRDKIIPDFLGSDRLLTPNDNIKGKRIFIYSEQNFSEIIMFSRFLKTFVKKGAKIIFSPDKPLRHLFEHSFKGISFVNNNFKGKFDYHIPLAEVGNIFGLKKNSIKMRGRNPYLIPCSKLKEKYKAQYFNNSSFKVGLVWKDVNANLKGNLSSINAEIFIHAVSKVTSSDNKNHSRSTKNKSFKFYSLQKEISEKENELLKQFNIVDLGKTFHSFSDTAAAIDSLDLVISADYTRYAKPKLKDNILIPVGIIAIGIPLIFIGAIMAVGKGTADIVAVMQNLGFPIWGFFVLWLASWTSQLVNNYTMGLSFSNILNVTSDKGRAKVTFVGTILSIILSLVGILDHFVYLLYFAALCYPAIAGVMFVHFFVCKQIWIDKKGWNIVATIAMVIGITVGYITTYVLPVGIPAIQSLFTTGIVYYIAMKFKASYSPDQFTQEMFKERTGNL